MSRISGSLKALGRGLWSLVKKYPVRAQGLVVAAIAAASAFGLGWNGAQVGAITGLSAAILSFLTESAVTPLSQPTLPQGTVVEVVTPPGQPNEAVVV
jgi:hypothetical protein